MEREGKIYWHEEGVGTLSAVRKPLHEGREKPYFYHEGSKVDFKALALCMTPKEISNLCNLLIKLEGVSKVKKTDAFPDKYGGKLVVTNGRDVEVIPHTTEIDKILYGLKEKKYTHEDVLHSFYNLSLSGEIVVEPKLREQIRNYLLKRKFFEKVK